MAAWSESLSRKLNIGARPPAIMIASYSSRASSDSFGVSASTSMSSGVLTNPIVIRSAADHFDGSRGSLSASICTLPPPGLATVTSMPRSVSS